MYKEEVSNTTAIVRCPSGELCILDLDQMVMTQMLDLVTTEPRSPEDITFCVLRKRDGMMTTRSAMLF